MKTRQTDYQLAARFDALSALADGWLDGRGAAPNKAKLAVLAEELVGRYPERFPLPAIAPTPEGGVLLEWDLPGNPTVDVHLASLSAEFHAFRPDGTEIEHGFHLVNDNAWGKFFAFLKETLENPTV